MALNPIYTLCMNCIYSFFCFVAVFHLTEAAGCKQCDIVSVWRPRVASLCVEYLCACEHRDSSPSAEQRARASCGQLYVTASTGALSFFPPHFILFCSPHSLHRTLDTTSFSFASCSSLFFSIMGNRDDEYDFLFKGKFWGSRILLPHWDGMGGGLALHNHSFVS